MRTDDLDYWFEFMQLPDIQKFIPDRFETQDSLRDTIEWLNRNYRVETVSDLLRLSLAIHTVTASDVPVGWVTFGALPEDDSKREIGYAVHPAFWGRGIATQAAAALIGFVRDRITVEPLYASVSAHNKASIRVLQKNGFSSLPRDHATYYRATLGTRLFVLP
jgi:ribosomal-protein-alanine N-acetyltransferase